jgi:predicted HAD superfamily Cof-like phosphohydrolase
VTSYFDDVGAFHEKFGLPASRDPVPPHPLDPDVFLYRFKFMLEELAEFAQARGAEAWSGRIKELMATLVVEEVDPEGGDAGLADGADALADLVYVALGTAHMMRLPFDQVWAEVQRANMAKERASSARDKRSKRGHALDVVKPDGWRGPDHWPLLYAAALAAR